VIAGVQPGDVLAVRSDACSAVMIRLGAALAGKPNVVNHIAIAHHRDSHGTLWCIEGRPGGVGWRDATAYLSSPWTLSNAAQPKTDAQRTVITDGAVAMLGTRYDWAAIIGDGLDDLHLWDPVDGQVHGEAVCSALAACLHDKAALARPAGGERKVQPADWAAWILTEGWRRP
jgi:hypothetical protein